MADYVEKEGTELGEVVNEDEDEWVVVSPTASAYAASPGPKVPDLVHKEKASAAAGNEAETSRALFMSDHFIYVPGQHENLPAVEEDQTIHKGEKDLASELQTEEGDRSKQKEKENINIPGLKIAEDFSVSNVFYGKGGSLPIHDSKLDEMTLLHGVKAMAVEQVIYDSVKNNEIPLGGSARLHDVIEPSESALDPVVPQDESGRKDDNSDKNYSEDPPSRAWWEKPVACLRAHVNETNAIWSIFIAAAVVGLIILGQKWQQERKQVLQQRLQLSLTTEKPETDVDAHSNHMGREEDFDQERFQEDFPLQFSTVTIENSPFPEDVHIGQVGISDIGSTYADSDNLHTQCDSEDEGERRKNYTEADPYDVNHSCARDDVNSFANSTWQQERKQVLQQRLQLPLGTEKPENDVDAHSNHMGHEENFDQERFQEDVPLQFSTVAIENSPFPEDVHIGQVGISDIESTYADSDDLHAQCDIEDEGERRMNYTEVDPYDINSKPTLAVGMKFANHEERYGEPIRDDKDWKLSAFQQRVRRDLQIDASLKQIYQAKRKALQFIHGHDLEQFFKLLDYCDLLKEKNLGSLAGMNVKIEGNNQFPTFRRLFLAFRACIKGFLEVRRPFIGLDGCHLRSGLSQILLSAVGRDPNNQMFPAAIALGKILPLGYKQLPGRPRKAGRKAGDEPKIRKKITRTGCKIKCSKCRGFGHNIRNGSEGRPRGEERSLLEPPRRRPSILAGRIGSTKNQFEDPVTSHATVRGIRGKCNMTLKQGRPTKMAAKHA
ncbi:ATG8-interacting protein 2-like protein [Drosera capensis]